MGQHQNVIEHLRKMDLYGKENNLQHLLETKRLHVDKKKKWWKYTKTERGTSQEYVFSPINLTSKRKQPL